MSQVNNFSRAALLPKGSDGLIPSLCGIRALAVMLVFAAHAGVSKALPGGFGVTVFFFLSGYLITELFIREWRLSGRIDLGRFFLRRVARLSPPLLFTLGVAYSLVAVGLADGELGVWPVLSQIFYFHNYHLTLAEDPSWAVEGLTLLWSLSVEEHFYLGYPLLFLAFASKRVGFRTMAAVLLGVLAWRVLRWQFMGADAWTIYVSTDTRIDSILYGCVLSLLLWRTRLGELMPRSPKGAALLIGGALALLVISFLWREAMFRATLRYSLQGLALMVLFYYAVHFPRAPGLALLNTRPMRLLGQYSYSIYLIHYVLLRVMEKHGLFEGNQAAFLATAAAGSIAYAAFVHRFIELPVRRMNLGAAALAVRPRLVPIGVR